MNVRDAPILIGDQNMPPPARDQRLSRLITRRLERSTEWKSGFPPGLLPRATEFMQIKGHRKGSELGVFWCDEHEG